MSIEIPEIPDRIFKIKRRVGNKMLRLFSTGCAAAEKDLCGLRITRYDLMCFEE
jgi:hypothetical protein